MLRRSLLLKYRRNTKMRKWISMLSMVLVITLAGSLKASAEVRVMPDGQLFDPEFYGQFNTDVAAIFGSDADTLYWHYLKAGKAEGRLPYLTEEMIAAIQAQALQVDAESGTPVALQSVESEALAAAQAAAAQAQAEAEALAAAQAQAAAAAQAQSQDPAQALLDALVKAAAGTRLDPQILQTVTGNLFQEMLPMAVALTGPELEQSAIEAYRQFELALAGQTQQAPAEAEAQAAAQAAAAAQAQAEAEAQAAAQAAAAAQAQAEAEAQAAAQAAAAAAQAQAELEAQAAAQAAAAAQAQAEAEAQAAAQAAAQAQAEAEALALAEEAAKISSQPQLPTTKELGAYLAQQMTDSITALGEPMLLVENNGGYIAVDASSGNYSAFSLASNKLCGANTVGAVEIYLKDKGWSVYGVRIGMTAEQAIKASANYGFTPENVNAVPNGSLYLRGEGSWVYVGLDKSGMAVVVDGYTYPYAAFGNIFG